MGLPCIHIMQVKNIGGFNYIDRKGRSPNLMSLQILYFVFIKANYRI